MKRRLLKFLVFIFSFMFFGALYIAFSKPVDYLSLLPENYESPNISICDTDEYGYTKIKLNEDRPFKVMQLTDTHIGYGRLSRRCDELAIKAIVKLIESQKPDIIVVSGDVVFTNFWLTLNTNNLKALEVFSDIMESFKTPWTITFGNHDEEGQYTKKELSEYLTSPELEYCVFDEGVVKINIGTSKEKNSYGNHVLNLYNYDDTLNSSLIMIDSNGHMNGSQLHGYERIENEQVDWFENVIESLPTGTPNHVYYHIPQTEYKDAWNLYKEGSEEVEYFFGKAGERGEKISTPVYRSLLFDKMVELGTTKSVYCGHNHLNNFSLKYKDIRLTFSLSIDYIAYITISFKTEQRGATILEIKPNREFDIYQKLLTNITE